jgi:membrane-associated phospholipid phosphatase
VVVGAAVLVIASWQRTHRRVSLALGAATLIVVATAQLVLGRHYPSDIVAGWLLAAAVLATAAGAHAFHR